METRGYEEESWSSAYWSEHKGSRIISHTKAHHRPSTREEALNTDGQNDSSPGNRQLPPSAAPMLAVWALEQNSLTSRSGG